MAKRLSDGSIKMADGRIIYADTIILGADLCEIIPLCAPAPAWPFVSGGGGGGSGSGTPGARGADGAAGAPGAQGPQGTNPGVQGPQGNQGNQGLTGSGAQGSQGNQGFQGTNPGPQGNQGNQGSGVQGSQGFQGSSGAGAESLEQARAVGDTFTGGDVFWDNDNAAIFGKASGEANQDYLQIFSDKVNNLQVFDSTKDGTGTIRPITWQMGGAQRMLLTADTLFVGPGNIPWDVAHPEDVQIQRDVNDAVRMFVINQNGGGSAYSEVLLSRGPGGPYGGISYPGAGYNDVPFFAGNEVQLSVGSSSDGIALLLDSEGDGRDQYIRFGFRAFNSNNGYDVMRIIHPMLAGRANVLIGNPAPLTSTYGSMLEVNQPFNGVNDVEVLNQHTSDLAAAGFYAEADSAIFGALYAVSATATGYEPTMIRNSVALRSGGAGNGLYLQTDDAAPIHIRTNSLEAMTIATDQGVVVGAATGGSQGAGTINVSGDIFKNGVAYTNPDYVFEQWACGEIKRFAKNPGAKDYRRMTLYEIEEHCRTTLRLPGIDDRPMGLFDRSDFALEKIEEIFTYLFELKGKLVGAEA